MVASRIGGVSVMKGRNPLEVRSVEIKVSTFWFSLEWFGVWFGVCFGCGLVHVGTSGVRFQTPFKIILVPFILKGTKLVPKGFGTWPLFFHFGPCWKKTESGAKLSQNHVRPFHLEMGQIGTKGVWNLTSAFPLCSMLSKWGQVPNPFKISLAPFIWNGARLVPKEF